MLSYAVIIIKVSLLLGIAGFVYGALLKPADARWIKGRPFWLMTLSFAVALLLPNIWILGGLMLVLLPMIARDRGEAVALYIVGLLALPLLQTPVSVAGVYLMPLSTYQSLSLGLLIASFLLPGRADIGRGPVDVAFLLLLGLNLFVSARGLESTALLRESLQVVLNLALPYWAVRRSVTRPQDLSRLLLALCFAGSVQSVIALYETKTWWPIYEMLSTHYDIPVRISQASKVRAGLMRGNGTFPESTSFSWFLAICLAATLILRDRFRSRTHWYVALAIVIGGLFATQARGGWVAALFGLALIDVYWRRWNAAGAKVAVAGILYAGLLLVGQHSSFVSESIGTSGGASTTVDYRQELRRRGMQEIAKHPWTGTDIATATANLQDLRQGEGIVDFVNAYIYYGLGAGVFGMAALALAFFSGAFSAARLRKKRALVPAVAQTGALCFAVSIFTSVSAYTSGFGGAPGTFYFILLAATAAALRVQAHGPAKASASAKASTVSVWPLISEHRAGEPADRGAEQAAAG